MSVAKYVYPDVAKFRNVVKTIQDTPLSEGDVNGLWCSAILPSYFPYHNTPQYALKPEFAHNENVYDILVTKQATGGTPVTTTWTWVAIFQGRAPEAEDWGVLKAQMIKYFQTSDLEKLYAIGAIGRFCKFWEWAPATHGDEAYQLIIDSATGNVAPRNGTFDPFDIADQSINVEKCIQYVRLHM